MALVDCDGLCIYNILYRVTTNKALQADDLQNVYVDPNRIQKNFCKPQ